MPSAKWWPSCLGCNVIIFRFIIQNGWWDLMVFFDSPQLKFHEKFIKYEFKRHFTAPFFCQSQISNPPEQIEIAWLFRTLKSKPDPFDIWLVHTERNQRHASGWVTGKLKIVCLRSFIDTNGFLAVSKIQCLKKGTQKLLAV